MSKETNGIELKARDIDGEGVWHLDGRCTPLLGKHMPIPDDVRLEGDPERQEILVIVNASEWLPGKVCPLCSATDTKGIILVTAYTKIYPAHCCDKMVWLIDKRDYNDIYEA